MGRPFSEPHPLPPRERLLELLSYDRETGILTWRQRNPSSFNGDAPSRSLQAVRWNSLYGGKIAGGGRNGEYLRLTIDGLHHLAHRVIWKMETGDDPIQIDHVDGDKTNNRFLNFRNVMHAVNMRNKSLYANSKSGFPGVEYHERDKVWRVKIGVDGAQIQLGSFQTKEEAIACRIGAQKVADYHDNHGRQP